MSDDNETTVARCTDCERVYAGYYASDGQVVPQAGKRCPNCGSRQFRAVQLPKA